MGIDNHMDEEALQEQSQFFSYFVLFTILCIVAYCMYFNKKKVIYDYILVMTGIAEGMKIWWYPVFIHLVYKPHVGT